MRRRQFVLLAGGAAVAYPVAARAQSTRVYRLGVLTPGQETIERVRRTVLPELARLGFVEGRNLALEMRVGPGDQLPALARDLAATRPDAVIAVSVPAIQAMREASDKTPIVGAFIGSDPIAAGFAASLGHPGGMITGILMLAPELDAKRLELLHHALPGTRRLAALAVDQQRNAPNVAAVTTMAKQADVELLLFYAATRDDYRPAFAAMRQAGAEAVLIISSPEFFTDASVLASLAIEARLPTMCEWAEMARSGCLLGYGPNFDELERRVAEYVARILNGAAPGELPIEEPTRFGFAINLKTAKTLDLTLPQSILGRADEVIE